MYPKVEVNIKGINENISKIKDLCNKNNINLNVVVKVLAGNIDIVKNLDFKNIDSIADSRISNLKKYKNIKKEKWLIRIPSFSEIEDVIKYSDVSLNSSLETIELLNKEAIKQKKKHKIILMYELGDLREGVDYSMLSMLVNEIKRLSNVELYGIGANLTCYGGAAPTKENTQELYEVTKALEVENDISIPVISGANSSSFKLLENGTLKDKMNYVRFGESVFLGTIPGYDEEVDFLNHDNFIIKAQISELETKDSVPRGEILKNSFGVVPELEDAGLRTRAIINIGKQDVGLNIKPVDKDLVVLEGSSDYLIVDLTHAKKEYKLGDIIEFTPDYETLLKVMTSEYVRKEIK